MCQDADHERDNGCGNCSIGARPLQRPLFGAPLEEAYSSYSDLATPMWDAELGTFLLRFQELCPEIKDFLHESKYAEYTQLYDSKWLLDLAFLTGLTNKLNELNLELQGK